MSDKYSVYIQREDAELVGTLWLNHIGQALFRVHLRRRVLPLPQSRRSKTPRRYTQRRLVLEARGGVG